MSDLIGNSEDRFSCAVAQMSHWKILSNFTIVCVTFRNCPILLRMKKRYSSEKRFEAETICIVEKIIML